MTSDQVDNGLRLLQWLKDNGGYVHPSIELRNNPNTGLSLFTTMPIPVDERIISCPFDLAVTPAVASLAIGDLTGVAEERLCWPNGDKWNERMLIAAYICLHWVWDDDHDAQNSRPRALAHGPYVASLPSPSELTTPLYFSASERSLLEATNLAGAVAEREAEWTKESKTIRNVLKKDGLTWERYLAVATYLSSRAFPSRLLSLPEGEVVNETQDAASHPVLLPGLDMLNHARGQPIVWLSSRIRSSKKEEPVAAISFVTAVSQEGNTEIFNNYGPKANEELLMEYGFVIPSNPDDTLGLRLGGATPEAQKRLAAKGLNGAERFAVGRDGELPARLLEVLRVMVGDEEEVDEDDDHAVHAHEEQSLNLELDVLGMLGEMLEDKMEKLTVGIETDGCRPHIVALATEYRKGQVDILNTALDKLGERVERVESLLSEGMECPCGC